MCKTCAETKPLEDFYTSKTDKDGRQGECKACVCARSKANRLKREAAGNKANRLPDYLMRNFKMTYQTYLALAEKGCAVCGAKENLKVDHDHDCCPSHIKTCGECVRGLLCHGCNAAEGLLGSDPDRVIALAMYLIKTKKEASTNA